MIKLQTEVDLPDFKRKMGYRHRSVMMGSCFAENIGIYLQDLCFPVTVNPFGILYNPVSIANSLGFLIDRKVFTEQDLFYSNGLYNSFSHHSRFSGPDPLNVLRNINQLAHDASDDLVKCHQLFITFGTSWVFKHKTTGAVVSNCHKLPASVFERFRLSVNQITAVWIPVIEQLRRINPELQLVFTVSPIRHLKDGAHENQLSKSTLLLAIDELISKFGQEVTAYFPSYELMLDELRDYRFYAADMTHPGEIALEIIREKFVETIMDSEARAVSAEIGKMLPSLKHRPLNNNEPGYVSFVEKQIERVFNLQQKYPFIDMKVLIKKFSEKRTD